MLLSREWLTLSRRRSSARVAGHDLLAVATSGAWRLQARTKEKPMAWFGVYRGVVLDNSDPQVSGRVKINVEGRAGLGAGHDDES